MDPFSLATSFLKPLLWLFPLLVLIAFLKSPLVKGWFGEKLVEGKGRRRLPPETYRAFHNVTIRDGTGTTQIDHVYVSPFGIFTVETKNYKGWIFGKESDSQWTQSIFKKKSRFQNPLRQNFKHTKTLASLLELPDHVFHSVIVFTGDCIFKTPMPRNICTLADFDHYIRSFKDQKLTAPEIQSACDKLTVGRLEPSRATNRQHVAYLRDRLNKRIDT